MKRFSLIFLGALVMMIMAGCSKKNLQVTPDEDAWVDDLSLPVPIQFGSSSFLETKAGGIESVEDLAGKVLGIYGLAKNGSDWTNGSDDALLYNERASVSGGQVNLEGGKKYYPRESDKNFSFYGIYPRFTQAAPSDGGLYVKVGKGSGDNESHGLLGSTDIIWAMSEAELEGGVDGYNAKYMRAIRKAGTYDTKSPSFLFGHVTAGLKIIVAANMDKHNGQNSNSDTDFEVIKIKKVTVKNVHRSGRLCLAGANAGMVVDLGNPEDVLLMNSSEGVSPTGAGVELGTIYPYPDEEGKYEVEVEVSNPTETYTVPITTEKLVPGTLTTYKLVFNKLDDVSIKVDGVAWNDVLDEKEYIEGEDF